MTKRTPLYEEHKKAGAQFTPFAGWEMPVVYTGIVQEHLRVRNSVGLFDISHMGQIFVEGTAALSFLQRLCTNDISRCKQGEAVYSHLCNESGGVVDDIFIYGLTPPQEYLVVVNAATSAKDFNWMVKNKTEGVKVTDRSEQLGMIAVQGPRAEKAVLKCFSKVPARHQLICEKLGNETLFICRTGYTGEDGFEIIAPNGHLRKIWNSILEAGKEFDAAPCGLGARDTLRLEMGYLLYGQDVDDDHSPLEAGVSWVVKFAKEDFIGKKALLEQKNAGLKRRLTAFKMAQRGIPRHNSKIILEGQEAGVVTSGTFSPSLQVGIAVGYVPPDAQGDFFIECHSKPVPALVAKLPFYSKN